MQNPEVSLSVADVSEAIDSILRVAGSSFGDAEELALLVGLPREAAFRPVHYRWWKEESRAKLLQRLNPSSRILSKAGRRRGKESR